MPVVRKRIRSLKKYLGEPIDFHGPTKYDDVKEKREPEETEEFGFDPNTLEPYTLEQLQKL